jgi:hypothetical protein
MTWQTIRTLTTQAAEAGVPSSALFVAHPEAGQYAAASGRVPYVEVGFDSLVLAGSPTGVVLAVWRLSDAKVEKVLAVTVQAADAAAPIPLDVEADAEALWITVDSFVGGTSPTLSGVLRYRPSRSGAPRQAPGSAAVDVRAQYLASGVTLTDGQFAGLLSTISGALRVSHADEWAGEDRSNTRSRTYLPNNYTRINTNSTTVVKSGAGTLHGITFCTKGATANVWTLYDNTAGSGTVIGVIDTTTAVAQLPFDVQFGTGLTIVSATGTCADGCVEWF